MEGRINYIDFLKTLGLISIIIAHVNPPKWIYMVRGYDVVLMVIISAILGSFSYKNYIQRNQKKYDYYISRFKRLIIPTWLFLIIYFFKCYILSGSLLDIRIYISSFLLTRYGIGYVWIILIYFMSSLLIPLLYKLKINKKNITIIILIYISYEMLYCFKVGVNIKVFDTIFYYIIPYGIVTLLGFNYYTFKKKTRISIIIIGVIIWITIGCYYFMSTSRLIDVQIVKYPPRLYFLGYSIGVSFILLEIFRTIELKVFSCKLVRYISVHSLWIYLWHILALDIYNKLLFPEYWYIKLIVVIVISISIVFGINTIIDKTKLDNRFKLLKLFNY